MSAILLDDGVVHYEVLGRGRPVLLLHGWVGSWRYWIPSMQSAAMRFRAYALDFWGFGDSDRMPDRYSLNAQVALVAGFLEKLGMDKVALVGHGLGAVVAMQFAQRWPTKVERLMAVALPSAQSAISPRLQREDLHTLAAWLLTPTPATEAARLEAPKADRQAVLASLADIRRLNLAQEFQALRVPTLLVHGLKDPLIQPPTEAALEALPQHVHQVFFEASGHFPMLDEGSKFHRLLFDFLTLPSGESPRRLQLKEEWKRRVR